MRVLSHTFYQAGLSSRFTKKSGRYQKARIYSIRNNMIVNTDLYQHFDSVRLFNLYEMIIDNEHVGGKININMLPHQSVIEKPVISG